MNELEKLLQTEPYQNYFNGKNLDNRFLFMTYGGSYAYGTNVEGSDIDVRGCVLNTKEEILLGRDFEQYVKNDDELDICIYSVNKLISLLTNCNPNTIEMLGMPIEKYAYLSEAGRLLIDNRKLFLSKKAIHSFGGYATQQLRRLSNKAARKVPLDEQQQHILNSMKNAQYAFTDRYIRDCGDLVLYLDEAKELLENGQTKEIFADIHLNHIPIRDFNNMMGEVTSVQRAYNKNSKRNEYAASHNKLGKHMMHLFRLYLMCFDILEKGEIITYRKDDINYLLDVRNGLYLDENDQPTEMFFQAVDNCEDLLNKFKEATKLPDEPDYEKINELRMQINEMVVNGGM